MVDAQLMAVVDRIDDLEEDLADQLVVAEVPLSLSDHPEEVPLLTELQHDVDAVLLLDDIVQCHDVRVMARERVQRDLPSLERPLTLVEADLVETLDGVEGLVTQRGVTPRGWVRGRPRGDVPCEVDDAICAESEDGDEFEAVSVDEVADEVLGVAGVLGGHGCLGDCVRVGRRDGREDGMREVVGEGGRGRVDGVRGLEGGRGRSGSSRRRSVGSGRSRGVWLWVLVTRVGSEG